MNNLFEENRQSFFLLVGLLFILLAVIYFLFFKPLVDERKLAETEVVELRNDIASLQKQVDQLDEGEQVIDIDLETKRLEKHMPSQPELKEFLLTLQEIELVSDGKIIDYTFSYDGSIPERQSITEENEEDEEENNTMIEEQNQDEETTETPSIHLPEMPENVRIVTVSMELFSPDYEHLQTFLKEIEKQERIMMISGLQFTQPGELELLETEDETITASIDVTTFYYEN